MIPNTLLSYLAMLLQDDRTTKMVPSLRKTEGSYMPRHYTWQHKLCTHIPFIPLPMTKQGLMKLWTHEAGPYAHIMCSLGYYVRVHLCHYSCIIKIS